MIANEQNGLEDKAAKLFEEGRLFQETGRDDMALTKYRAALELDKDHIYSHIAIGNILSRRGLLDEAIAKYLKATKVDPKYHVSYNNLGHAYRKKGADQKAETVFRKAISLAPDYADAHHNLVKLLITMSRKAEGENELRIAREL